MECTTKKVSAYGGLYGSLKDPQFVETFNCRWDYYRNNRGVISKEISIQKLLMMLLLKWGEAGYTESLSLADFRKVRLAKFLCWRYLRRRD